MHNSKHFNINAFPSPTSLTFCRCFSTMIMLKVKPFCFSLSLPPKKHLTEHLTTTAVASASCSTMGLWGLIYLQKNTKIVQVIYLFSSFFFVLRSKANISQLIRSTLFNILYMCIRVPVYCICVCICQIYKSHETNKHI